MIYKNSVNKAPKALIKLKEKELSNALAQLNIYKKENIKLKQQMTQNQTEKETFSSGIFGYINRYNIYSGKLNCKTQRS